jgi:hypothetical protein
VNKDNLTVSNFKNHIKGEKHTKNFAAQQHREAAAIEKVEKEQAELKSKREGLIAKHAYEGEP